MDLAGYRQEERVRKRMDARDQHEFDQNQEVFPGEQEEEREANHKDASPVKSDAPSLSSPKKPAADPYAGEEAMSSERSWYVVHCYSGYENKVRHNLEQRIDTMGMKEKIFDVVIPTQEEIEVKDGKRRTVERHVFPGYVLVNMVMTEESWYVVRNTPGVTGFVGMGNQPTPLRPEEVAQILRRMEAEAPRVKVTFRVGERVRIVDGPFNDFRGTVSEIDMERSKVRVMVNFFGRETPVELDFLQVEKA
jgi:transcription termination/antitermination protein NusG